VCSQAVHPADHCAQQNSSPHAPRERRSIGGRLAVLGTAGAPEEQGRGWNGVSQELRSGLTRPTSLLDFQERHGRLLGPGSPRALAGGSDAVFPRSPGDKASAFCRTGSQPPASIPFVPGSGPTNHQSHHQPARRRLLDAAISPVWAPRAFCFAVPNSIRRAPPPAARTSTSSSAPSRCQVTVSTRTTTGMSSRISSFRPQDA